MRITNTHDMPMALSGIDVYSLDGLGCGCSTQKAATGIDTQKERLLTLRKNIIANPTAYATELQPDGALNAIDYVLKNWDNPTQRAAAIQIIAQQSHKVYATANTTTALKGIFDTIINSAASFVPGGSLAVNAANAVGINTGSISNTLKNLFSSPSGANNAPLRAELDKFTIPADFDEKLYESWRPDVVKVANQLGLNDMGYVRKWIAAHYFIHGQYEGNPYPYKQGYGPAPAPTNTTNAASTTGMSNTTKLIIGGVAAAVLGLITIIAIKK